MAEVEGTRQRILEAAGPLFAEKGFRATNVREICEQAGANIGAVNYHFRNKQQLYVETVKHAYQACANQAPLPSWQEDTPAEQRLRDFIRAYLSRLSAAQHFPVWYSQLLMREVSNPSDACLEFVREFVKPTFSLLQDILAELLPDDLPVMQRHVIGHSIIGQCLHYHHGRSLLPLVVGKREYGRYDVEFLAQHIADFSLAAIRHQFPDKQGDVPRTPEKREHS